MPRKRRSPAPPSGGPKSAPPSTQPASSEALVAVGKQRDSKPQPCAPSRVPQPAPVAVAKAAEPPRTHRELAEAIFAQCDPVAVGRELLESGGSERGGSVKARVWERLVEFLLGKPAAAPKQETLEIIWDLPGPPRDPNDP